MAESLFTTQTPATQTSEAAPGPTLGTVIVVAVAGQVTHLKWFTPTPVPTNVATLPFVLYNAATQAELARVVPGSLTANTWNTVALPSPVSVAAGTRLVVAIRTADRYAVTSGLFATAGITNGNLSSPATDSDPIGNGRFRTGLDAYPSGTFGGNGYFTDIVFSSGTPDTTAPGVPTGLAVTAVGPTTADLTWNPSTDDVGVTGYEVVVTGP